MSGAVNRDPELPLITGLCRELAKLGLNVGMSDARPAAVVRTHDEPHLLITVIPPESSSSGTKPRDGIQ